MTTRIERFGYTLLGLGLTAWFGLPVLKMFAFMFTGSTNFGPQIYVDLSDSPEPTNLGGRLFCFGLVFLIGAAICLFNRSNRR